MFTLFFGGNKYAPRFKVNGNEPIQDFLQRHYIQTFATLAREIMNHDPALWDDTVLGYDTMNEPNGGFIGWEDLNELPARGVRIGAMPNFVESVRLCMGKTVRVSVYGMGLLGMRKTGTTVIDPKGASCWQRGKNVWLNEELHDLEGNLLVEPSFFRAGDDPQAWMNTHWKPFAKKFMLVIREIAPRAIMFAEGAVMEVPPKWSNAINENVVFTPHFYDGLTLMHKSMSFLKDVHTYSLMDFACLEFNVYNADGYAVVKGESPFRSTAIGYEDIKDVLTRSLEGIKLDGMRQFGLVPCLIGEIGTPCMNQHLREN
jgi:hypothetical protein